MASSLSTSASTSTHKHFKALFTDAESPVSRDDIGAVGVCTLKQTLSTQHSSVRGRIAMMTPLNSPDVDLSLSITFATMMQAEKKLLTSCYCMPHSKLKAIADNNATLMLKKMNSRAAALAHVTNLRNFPRIFDSCLGQIRFCLDGLNKTELSLRARVDIFKALYTRFEDLQRGLGKGNLYKYIEHYRHTYGHNYEWNAIQIIKRTKNLCFPISSEESTELQDAIAYLAYTDHENIVNRYHTTHENMIKMTDLDASDLLWRANSNLLQVIRLFKSTLMFDWIDDQYGMPEIIHTLEYTNEVRFSLLMRLKGTVVLCLDAINDSDIPFKRKQELLMTFLESFDKLESELENPLAKVLLLSIWKDEIAVRYLLKSLEVFIQDWKKLIGAQALDLLIG